MEEIKIESNVPLPNKRGIKHGGISRQLAKVNIGDSFVIPFFRVTSYIGCGLRIGMKFQQQRISDTESRLWRIK